MSYMILAINLRIDTCNQENTVHATLLSQMITCEENNIHTTLCADLSFRLTVAGFRRNTSFELGNFTMIALTVASYVTAVDTRDIN